MRINLDKIKRVNWYRQGGAIKLFYVFSTMHSINETIGYDRNIIFQDGGVNIGFFDRDGEGKKFRAVIKNQIKDKKYIDRWISDWKRKNDKALDYAKKSVKSISKWTDSDLKRFLVKFNTLWLISWKRGIIMEWSDPDGHDILLDYVNKSGIKLTDADMNILVTPEDLSFAQRELISRVGLAKSHRKGRDIAKRLSIHVSKFHFMHNTWAAVEELDEKYFMRLIVNEKDLAGKEKGIKAVYKNLERIRKQKRSIIKAKKMPASLVNIFYLYQRMAEWREDRKFLCTGLGNHYQYQILKRLAKENRLPEEKIEFLTYKEVNGWKLSKEAKDVITKRNKLSAYLCDVNKNCSWFYGQEAQKIYDALVSSINTKDIKGIIANKGRIKGKVRIVEEKHDFKKFKKGDILVAYMTRPEYLPLMKIAGGIVTNEGGLTCHAAIVSRELNKPCIIGTQIATEKLKDGDYVEVDADEGIVKILK